MKPLSDQEWRILEYLAEEGDAFEGFLAFGFTTLMRETGYDRKTVVAVCRSLAARGLAGAGYFCTKAGFDLVMDTPESI